MLNGVNLLSPSLMSLSTLRVKNVMVDAFSRKCMLVTQLELNVIGSEHVKDLYEHDAYFC